MKFQVGSKVKFLNEEGGGVVTEIISTTMVKVMTEDGFALPTMNNELVLIEEPKTHSEGMFTEEFNVNVEYEPQIPQASSNKNIKHAKEAAGVYLAIVPHDQKWLITGMADLYLINHTSYDILYSILLKNENGYSGYDFSSVEPQTAMLLDSVEREDLDFWKEGIVQIIYQEDQMQNVLLPAHSNFKLKSARLNNENSYQANGLVDGKAMVISLNEIFHQEKVRSYVEEKQEVKKTEAKVKKEEAIIDRHMILPKVAEVDLHIAEIVDNISGMESRDMLAIQKRYFKECLESAIANDYQKVTFIHGVGNGILKNAIVQTLKEYENTDNHAASIAKYGVGAIDVLIKPWE
ncbi:MAG: hypothetical protein CL663_03590 [Bacteroidetes bacterium]|nr:hypothetical protein [Bacteroidota bacterium]